MLEELIFYIFSIISVIDVFVYPYRIKFISLNHKDVSEEGELKFRKKYITYIQIFRIASQVQRF